MLVIFPAPMLTRFRAITIAAVVLIMPSLVLASATELPAPITASGEAYLRAVDGEDIDTSVVYYDPSKEGPIIDAGRGLAEDSGRSRQQEAPFLSDWTRFDILVMIVCALVILAILWLVVKYGGAIRVSLDKAPGSGGRRVCVVVTFETGGAEIQRRIWPIWLVDTRRRFCDVASAGVRGSVV
jgi:hypothetical protein